ncbi:MAG: hypothetical protein AB7T06_02325 [Kofleriaceae bacterium]
MRKMRTEDRAIGMIGRLARLDGVDDGNELAHGTDHVLASRSVDQRHGPRFMLGLYSGERNLSCVRLGWFVLDADKPLQTRRGSIGTWRARGAVTNQQGPAVMKKTNLVRKPLQLKTETLRILQDGDLANVAGGVADAPEAFPTNGCRTIIGSFNGNCCNTKQV